VDGAVLHIPDLAAILSGTEIGTWSMGPESLEFLVHALLRRRPMLTFEFGSGASTIAVAWAVREVGKTSQLPQVVSIEQDPEHAESTRDFLRRSGLSSHAIVIHAPIEVQRIGGIQTVCYRLPPAFEEAVAARTADFVVVDGPAGVDGARFGTLPLIKDHVERAAFVLDDALRDGELGVASQWAQLPYIRIAGIRLIEKGLLTGEIVSTARMPPLS
jgi:hypothetical protein